MKLAVVQCSRSQRPNEADFYSRSKRKQDFEAAHLIHQTFTGHLQCKTTLSSGPVTYTIYSSGTRY